MSSASTGHSDTASALPQAPGTAPGSGARLADRHRVQRATARYAPVLLPVIVMAVAGLWGLARDSSMGNDEVATRWAALLSLRELAHLVRHVDAVHGLYYLLMHAWVVVGSSPAVLRIPSVIAMAAGAGLVAAIGRRLTGSGWAGLFAGLIMALTPTISFYAQTARSYAFVFACVLGATLALLTALDAEKSGDWLRAKRRWIAYAVLVAVGGYLNEMSLLVLAAHAITVLLARYGRECVKHWVIAAAGGAIVVLPLFAVSIGQHGAIGWIARPGLLALRTLFRNYFGASTVVGALVLACAVVAALPERRPGEGTNPWWARGGVSLPSVAAPLLVLPAALLLAESLVGPPLYVDRYVLYGEAGAALLAGAGVWRIGQWLASMQHRRALIALPGIALCVCALVLQLGPQHRVRTPESRQFDFGGASRYVGAHARQGDGVLYFGTLFRKAQLGYPADFTKVRDFGVALTPLQAGTFRGTDKPFSAAGPLMLKYQRIWVLGLRPSAQQPDGLLRQESMLLESRFTLVARHHFRGIVVTLWRQR